MLQIRKNAIRFAHFPFDVISFYLLMLTSALKLKHAPYKTH